MIEFDDAIVLYNLYIFHADNVIDVNTSKGYMRLFKKKMECNWIANLTIAGLSSIPYYFLREGDCLYLMKQEPAFYK